MALSALMAWQVYQRETPKFIYLFIYTWKLLLPSLPA